MVEKEIDMSQGQPRRPQQAEDLQHAQEQPVKYGECWTCQASWPSGAWLRGTPRCCRPRSSPCSAGRRGAGPPPCYSRRDGQRQRGPRGQGPNHGPRRRSGHGRDGRGQGGRQSNAAAIQVCFCLFCCVSRSISPMLLT